MDHRDVAGHYHPVLTDIDHKHLRATFTAENDDGEEIAYRVRLKFDVCDTCEGRGLHVAPSIDAHGLSREDFDEDPDFAEEYISGRYDVPCAECHGARVVPVVDPEANDPAVVALYQACEQAAWDEARTTTREREMGY